MAEESRKPPLDAARAREVEEFRRRFQAAILKEFLDHPPEPEPLQCWEVEEDQQRRKP